MAVTLYSWDDAGSPGLTTDIFNGTDGEGSLIEILKACLVDGYGSKPAAGWTMPFESGSPQRVKVVFRNAITNGGSGSYFRFSDREGGERYTNAAECRGYTAMTSIDSGINPFPTTLQRGNQGLIIQKWVDGNRTSATNSGSWWVVANEHCVYIFCGTHSSVGNGSNGSSYMFFGDPISYVENDNGQGTVWGSANTSGSTYSDNLNTSTNSYTELSHICIAKDHTGLKYSQYMGIHADYMHGPGRLGAPPTGHIFPNPIDGRLLTTKVYLHYDSVLRGEMPGLRAPCHNKPFTHGGQFDGEGDLAGRTFKVFDTGAGSSRAQVLLEISDTWYT